MSETPRRDLTDEEWAALARASAEWCRRMEQARALQCREGEGCGAH